MRLRKNDPAPEPVTGLKPRKSKKRF